KADGTFTAGSLKPGTYTVHLKKYLYDFGSGVGVQHQVAAKTVGPSSSGNSYNAVTP
ncbi:MAG: hypothetical protein HZA16_11615, partial [Nitrospirae bacterium]|nr:hypothetical protein [Nitrospirota bacterium]